MGKLFDWISRKQQMQMGRDNLIADYVRRHEDDPAVEFWISAMQAGATPRWSTGGAVPPDGSLSFTPVSDATKMRCELAVAERDQSDGDD